MTSDKEVLNINNLFAQREALMERVLKDPSLINSTVLNGTLVELVHKYIDSSDQETQMVYLHYLLGKDFEESAHMLNIPESRVLRYFHTFISRFNRFIANQLKEGDIDIERAHSYIKLMHSKKIDDRQIADRYGEDMLTTKIMKHFLRHASVISQFFVCATVSADALEITSLVNFIHILPPNFFF